MNLIQRTRRMLCVGLAFFMVAMVVVVPPASAAGGLQLDGLETISYEEGGPPVPVAPNVIVSGGGTFADGYIEFTITGGNSEDRLFLPEDSEPDTTKDAITVIGAAVYLGLGNDEFKQIGTVNTVNDGRDGRPLRIDFSAALPNADFSGEVDANGHPVGWTINDDRVILPASLATKTQARPLQNYTQSGGVYTVNHAEYSFESDRAFGANASTNGHQYEGYQHELGTYNAANYTGTVEDGALHLRSKSTTCANEGYKDPFCSVFGPEAWSSPFDAKAGDDLAFDWRAAKIDDDYEVYGFLVDVDTDQHYELMYGRGGLQDWRTSAGVIPADGTYKFRFISGTFDYTGGLVVGASLYIDNVRVLSADANNAVAQSVARLVHYENTGQNPPSELTIGVTAESSEGTVEDDVETEIELVDDAPVFNPIADVVFANTEGTTTFANATGSIVAIDPESDPITYSIDGAVANVTTINSVTYTHSKSGTYGTLHLNESTGAYVVVPNSSVLDGVLTPDFEEFGVIATANGLSDSATLTVRATVQSSPPGAPTALTATAGDQQVTLNWTAPEWVGGDAITGYLIEEEDILTEMWTTVVANTNSTDTTYTVTGLNNGQTRNYRVKAINDSYTGAASNAASARPMGLPGAPTSAGQNVGDETLRVIWDAPANNGGGSIIAYHVEMSTDGGTTWSSVGSTDPDDRRVELTGLTNGQAVSVRIAAENPVGVGPWLTVTHTPFGTPSAPQNLTATPGDQQISLSWDAPLDNGGAIVSAYKVERSGDNGDTWTVVVANVHGLTTSYDVTGLTNGDTSQFRVSAINMRGAGDLSDVVTSTPRTVPGAPTGLEVYAGPEMAYLVWGLPLDDGGAPVTSFRVEKSIDGGTTWTTVTADTGHNHLFASVTGLTNGQLTHFRVSAHNEAGVGSPSAAVAGTPHTTPSAPLNVEATPGNTFVDLEWEAPLSNGGNAVSGYEIYAPDTDPLDPWVRVGTVTGGATTTFRVEGLTNGVPATFVVAAVNDAGPGDLSDAVTATPRTVPTAPVSLTASPINEGVVLSWNNPVSNGGAAITGFRVEYSTDGGTTWTTDTANTGSTDRVYTVEGLTNGQSTQFRVAAINMVGTGEASTIATATPRTIAGAPTNVVATPGSEQVTLTWHAPADNGGAAIVGYRIQVSTDGGATWTTAVSNTTTSDTTATVTGLTNGEATQLRVLALNEAGVGAPSDDATATPRTVPGAPTNLVTTPGQDQAMALSWTAPTDDGGNPIAGYTIDISYDHAVTWSTLVADTESTDTSWNVTGLTNGTTYLFRVSAFNEAGNGPTSNNKAGLVHTVPGAPTDLVVTPGSQSAELRWVAPADDGGVPVIGYRIEKSTDGGTTWVVVEAMAWETGTVYVATGLSNGEATEFRVSAINAAGAGAPTSSASTTPRTTPTSPLNLQAEPADGAVALSWTAPVDDGGNAVAGYKVEQSNDGGATWTVVTVDTESTNTTYDVIGLDNGNEYSFRVSALNEAGAGTTSDVATATPYTVPTAPVITSVVAGNRIVTVNFNAPSFDGGSDILTYEYSYDGGIIWHESKSGTSSPLVISPLSNGTTYPIQIRAKNAAGYGPMSNQLPATPKAAPVVPGAPGSVGSGGNGGTGGSGGAGGASAPLTVDSEPRDVTVTLPAAGGAGGSGGSGTGSGAGGNGDAAAPVVIRYADGDFHVDVAGTDQNGTPTAAGPNNELHMTKGGTVTVSGGGFEPGTTVDIWIMGDEPMLLGEATVGPDGTFTIDLPVPESAVLGLTELQVNGVGDDGSVRSLNIAAEVLDATAENNPGAQSGAPRRPSSPDPTSLAFTGSRVFVWTLLGLVLLVGGVASIVISTNRNRRDDESLNAARTLS